MALYREGKAALAADGTVTGTGTKWQSSLSLIRPGATIIFLSSPIQMAVLNKVVSDTEIKAITTNGAVVASTDYAILLSDSLTVDGLAQDVAETLRYYQSQETVIADAVDFFKDFDFESLQNLANQIKADSESAESSAAAAAASENAAKTSETNSKASEVAAETARDQVQQIINGAGEQSTLVLLSQPDGLKWIGKCKSISSMRETHPTYEGQEIVLERSNPSGALVNAKFTYDSSDTTTPDDGYSVIVTADGKRWKADVSNGVDIRTHELLKSDGSNFGSVLNSIIRSEVKKMVAASSLFAGNTKINIPAKLVHGSKMFLTADEPIIQSSLFSITFESNARIEYNKTTGSALSINNYPYYVEENLNGWNLETYVHQHAGCFGSLAGEIEIVGISSLGENFNKSAGVFLGNTKGNTENTGILNVRNFRLFNVKSTGFFLGLDATVQSTYLNTIENCLFVKNYHGIGNSIPDVSNGGERIRLVNCTISNNTLHGIYWGAISAGIVFDSCSIDYNGGAPICMSYYGRGNRFIFTNQCWIEGWGEGHYMLEVENSGAWATDLHNSFIFEPGTYVLPRNASTGKDWPRRPIMKNRSNVTDYVSMDGVFIDFKGKGASKEAGMVELGSQTKMVLSFKNMLNYPDRFLTNYRHSLNYGMYNFSGVQGSNLKGQTDEGTKFSFITINNDAALSITYGEVDTSDSNTYTQAQEVNVSSSGTNARFIIQNNNINIPLNNPDEKIYAGITIDPEGITSGSLVVNLRLAVYKASDMNTLLTTYYGGDVKLSDYSSIDGDGSGLITLQCHASVPTSAVADYGGSIVVVPALHFIGAVGSYKIRLPAFWR